MPLAWGALPLESIETAVGPTSATVDFFLEQSEKLGVLKPLGSRR